VHEDAKRREGKTFDEEEEKDEDVDTSTKGEKILFFKMIELEERIGSSSSAMG